MDLDPIIQAPLPVKIHLATVLPAFAIGTWMIFFSSKGARLHRAFGYTYWVLMLITAASTVFIRGINGGFSFIHLFIPLTLWSVYSAYDGARKGNVHQHRNAMIGLYIGGLIIAGALAFQPGRLMNQIFFGS